MAFITPRFFYDAAIAEAGAGAEIVEQPIEQEKTDAAAGAGTGEDAQAETITKENPAAQVQEAAVRHWKDEIRSVDKKEVLNELGIDTFMQDAIDYYQKTGDVTPYLEAKTVDFSKMSDEAIMKYDLRQQYKSLSDEEFNLLYEEEVQDKYRLNRELHEVDSAAARTGLVKLKVDAEKARQANMQRQQSFKAPEKVIDPSIAANQKQQEIDIQNFQNTVKTSGVTKSLTQNKKVVLGEGENAYNFVIEQPQALIDAAINTPSIRDFIAKEGSAGLENFYAVTNYAINRKAVEAGLIEHGIQLGKIQAHKERANAEAPDAKGAIIAAIKNPATALATGGKLVPGRVGN